MMHSIDTNINSDDVVVLNPNGKLYLSLVKNTYETFGMEAMKRTKMDVKHDKHSKSNLIRSYTLSLHANFFLVVMIDFKSPTFKAGSNQYNRLKWCLENTLTSSFKMIFCATDSCKLE